MDGRFNQAPRSAPVDQRTFHDPDLPAEQRIDSAIAAMTLDEKIACLGTNPSVPRLGINGCGHVEGLHGLAMGGPANWAPPVPVPTTTFPQAYGLGEMWDPDLIRRAAAAEATEVRYLFQCGRYAAKGGLIVRAPNADLGRDPRWGRTEECYGEDPFLTGTLTVAFVKGLQGDHPRYWLTASLLKHFLANSNEETRERSSSDFDQRLLREYYSVPFRMGIVEGGCRAFMAAYNAFNGIPCTVHPILRNITMKEWGLDGIICTDGGALKLLVSAHKYFPSLAQAAAWSVRCGITQFLDNYRNAIVEAVEKGLLAVREIEEAIRGNLRIMIKLGLLDPPERVPYSSLGTDGAEEPWHSEIHKSLARLVTQKSIVLLKNDERQLLPLDRGRIRSIAVIGPRADEVLLDWYSGRPPYRITPLEGIRQKLDPNVTVHHAADNTDGAAVKAARAADVAVVCVGNHPTCSAGWAKTSSASEGKEAVDRKLITLEAEELIKQVHAANPNTVIVLISSFPYAINWTQQNVPAILHMTHNSQETGRALADVLFGDFNPAGRLTQTWVRSLDDLPDLLDYDLRRGRTYLYFKGEPLYPFGHGLSYTSFAYSNLRTSPEALRAEGEIAIDVDITNSGRRSGEEVVQLYIRYLNSCIERPIKELKGFRRVALEPGQTRTITFKLAAMQLAYWNVASQRFIVEPGSIQLQIGSSSSDIRLEKTLHISE